MTIVLALDLGTSSAKAAAFDADGTGIATHTVDVPIAASGPGRAEQDADELVAAAGAAIAGLRRRLAGRGLANQEIAAVGLSGAMHSLLALDETGKPLTPAILYGDRRALHQARKLSTLPGTRELVRRTGTPLHPMAPLVKLRWFAEEDPATAEQARWWVSAKDYLCRALTGEEVVDHSTASATGLFDVVGRDWDPEALALAGIGPDRLFRPIPTTTVLESTGAFDLPAGTPIVAGAADGCLATLGAGAVGPGTAALTISTSGAIRAIVDRPERDPEGRLFCYILDDRHYVIGGPISSGGFVLRWARDSLFPQLAREAGSNVYARFDELASAVPPGADGLICLPYLLGERAPVWDPDARAALVGLTAGHGQGHVVRALLEGVALQLSTVLDLVNNLRPVTSLRADGGFTRSPVWVQIVADVVERQLELPDVVDGACRGAALIAIKALGLGDAIDLAAATPIARVVTPERMAADTYREIRPRFVALRDLLVR